MNLTVRIEDETVTADPRFFEIVFVDVDAQSDKKLSDDAFFDFRLLILTAA